MMSKWKFGLPAATVLCAVLLASCSNFFTTSWGKDWARDPSTIKVTTKNVKSLLKESKGDAKASRGILDKIAAELKNNPNQPELQAAAITAANQASGLTELVLENINLVLNSDSQSEDTFNKLLTEVQGTAKNNDMKGISDNIVTSLGPAVTSSGKPQFTPGVIDDVSDAELAQLALTLILAESESQSTSVEDYLAGWGTSKKTDDATTLSSPSESIIAAVANELTRRGGELGNNISGLLG
ncbi:MAG: hypothetical protein LBI94_03575 [Treponema sp.]|nr:hypothetical protein [Treponema sp.]